MSAKTSLPASATELAYVPAGGIMGSLFRLTVDQYDRLVETGVLDGEPIELIDGFLVRKMGKKPPHVIVAEALRDAILPLLPPGWRLAIKAPVRIPEFDEPEPDLAIVRGARNDYADHHPGPTDIGLLIEVADTTLDRDRGAKLLAYSRGGVSTYWIVNLVDGQIEVYTVPTPTGYRDRRVLTSGDEAALILGEAEVGRIAVSTILPQRG
jgi:Uma2 family endonuclease